MQIEKAYLFARQISASGPAPLPDNVYFDAGRFNLNLIPDGFDFVNNVQRFPIGAMSQGETQINTKGYFDQYMYTGSILATYGGGGKEFILTQNGLEHIYEQGYYPLNYFYTAYYLPLKHGMPANGETKICFNIATSNEGVTDGSNFLNIRLGAMYHDPHYDEKHFDYMFLFELSDTPEGNNTPTLVERTLKVSISEIYSFPDSELTHVFIKVIGAGTYIIRKIWFE